MSSCRQVKRNLVDYIDGGLSRETRAQIEAHLRLCVPCAEERDAMSGIASIIAAAGAVAPGPAVTGLGFEQRVMASLRDRQSDAPGSLVSFRPPVWPGFPVFRRPAPLQAAAAAVIMVLAGVIAVLYGGFTASRDVSQAPVISRNDAGLWDDVTRNAGFDGYDTDNALSNGDLDMLVPVREVPFSLRQDLVGVRSGMIPATTYVLEPAPDDSAVMRASF